MKRYKYCGHRHRGEVHIVILTDTCFEHFFKPALVGVILEMIFSGGTVQPEIVPGSGVLELA